MASCVNSPAMTLCSPCVPPSKSLCCNISSNKSASWSSFSCKGTQSELITQKYGLVHISAGDLLRAKIDSGIEKGRLAKEFMERGQLAPDEILVTMVDIEDHSHRVALENRRGLSMVQNWISK